MEIVELGVVRVVGLPVRATWKELWTAVPAAWKGIFGRLDEVENRVDERLVEVSLDKSGDEYIELIGARVTEIGAVPRDMWAVEVPAQAYIYSRHVGPVTGIADSFARMYEWAEAQGHTAGQFKLDIGYTVEGDEEEHDLYIGLLPPTPWRLVGE